MRAKAPYYESRFLRANNPDRPQALWLRSTLLLPTAGEPVADVWVMVFDPDGAGNRALKQPYPIEASDYEYDTWTARIGATTIDDRSAQGVVTGPKPIGALGSADHTGRPSSPSNCSPSAGTKRGSRRPRRWSAIRWRSSTASLSSTTSGSWSTAGPAASTTTGADGIPPPTRSARYAVSTMRPNRAWRSSPRTRPSGPFSLPAATLFVLRHGGKEFAVRSVPATRHTNGSYRPFSWSFTGPADGIEMEGQMSAAPGDVIGLTYTDTDGETKYCYNSALATCRLRLYGPHFGEAELNATRRAMFEILTDARHDAVPLLA